MHNGVVSTLMGVVVFYDSQSSIANLRLSQAEMQDLVEYLKALWLLAPRTRFTMKHCAPS